MLGGFSRRPHAPMPEAVWTSGPRRARWRSLACPGFNFQCQGHFVGAFRSTGPQSVLGVPCIQRRGRCTASVSERRHNFGSVMPSSKAKRNPGVNFDMHVKVYIQTPPRVPASGLSVGLVVLQGNYGHPLCRGNTRSHIRCFSSSWQYKFHVL